MAVPVKDVEPLTDLHSKIVEILDYLATVGLGNTDATLLEGEPGSFYRDASNLNAGTLPDARLSGNVPLKNVVNTFTDIQGFANATSGIAAVYIRDKDYGGVGAYGAALSIIATNTGGVVFRPTSAANVFDPTKDFLYDSVNDRWQFDEPPFVGNNPIAVAGPFLGQVINAADYGLRESATAAVNTAALNTAAQAIRDAVESEAVGVPHTPAILRIPPGRYLIAVKAGSTKVGWDMSMMRLNGPFHIDGRGAVLVCDATLAGKVVIDMIGSRWFRGYLPEIQAMDSLNPPLTGVQLGRFDDTTSAGGAYLIGLQISGYFTRACVHNLHSEVSVFIHPIVFNYQNAATAYAWIQDGFANWLPQSDADTSTMTQTAHSFLNNSFIGGNFWAAGGSIGVAMHISRAWQHVFKNSYFVSSGLTAVEIANEASDLRFEDCHYESVINHCVRFVSILSDTTFVLSGLTFREIRANPTDSIFGIAAALTTVTLNNFELSLHDFKNVLTQGIFESPAKVSIKRGRVYLPNLTYWQAPAQFLGTLETPTTFLADPLLHRGRGLADQEIVLADDTAVAVTLPTNCGNSFLLALAAANNDTRGAVIWVTPSLNLSAVIAQSAVTFEILNGTVLTGTTGTDARVTVGVTAGVLYLENRMGGSRIFSLSFLANR